MLVVAFVLLADELDQFGIRQNALINRDGPRLGVRLWIVDGDFDFQMPVIRGGETFS